MPSYPSFKKITDRQALVKQLQEAAENGNPAANSDLFREYLTQLTKLNRLMDEASEIDEFGVPKTLDAAGKEKLMQAMKDTGVAAETFLADVQLQNGDPESGIPFVVNQLQGMLSRDYEVLNTYDPAQPLSFPEIQEDARTQVIDFRGLNLGGAMRNRLSDRIPMTVVDLDGKRTTGVFTKAVKVNILEKYNRMIEDAASYYDRMAEKGLLAPYKNALIKRGDFGGKTEDQITDDDVVEKLKEPLRSILPKFRESFKKEKGGRIRGVKIDDMSDEMIIGYLYNSSRQTGMTIGKLLKESAGVDIDELPGEVGESLLDGFNKNIPDLSNMVNARDLGLKDGARVDNRNSAMSAVASVLGLNDICARSVNMKYLDENGEAVDGTFMEFADGLDLCGKNHEQDFKRVNNDPFGKGLANADLANLAVMDFISGNVDRHGGNMSYKTDKDGNIIGVMAFDNDSSFGVTPVSKNSGLFRLAGVNQLRVITASMADKISNMTPEMLKFTLRGRGLTEEEIRCSCDRLDQLKKAVNKGVRTADPDEIEQGKGQLFIVEDEDMKKIPFETLAKCDNTVFKIVKKGVSDAMEAARKNNIEFDAEEAAEEAGKKVFTEVMTNDFKYTAGGISESMRGMDRAISDDTKGFEVSQLSKWLRSSSKWRSMVSSVKNAVKAAKKILKAIQADDRALSRNDPKVQKQLREANDAMAQVERANNDYLAKKMREKGVKSPEELVGRGKSEYEQKRIDYALKVRSSIMEYKRISNPESPEAKAEQADVMARLNLRAKRNQQPEHQQPEHQLQLQ